MLVNVSGLPILLLVVLALALFAFFHDRARQRLRTHPETGARQLAQSLSHQGQIESAVRVIKRNTGWSRQLCARYVSALTSSGAESQLPDVIDDYPDLPRETTKWVQALLCDDQEAAAVIYIADQTGWALPEAEAYLQRFSPVADSRGR